MTYRRYAAGRVGVATLKNPPGPTRTVVWLPFGGGSSRAFKAVADHSPADWRVLALDGPGHVLTDGAPLRRPEELCRLFFDALGLDTFAGAILAGQSVGGLMAAYMTQQLEAQGVLATGCVIGAARPPNTIPMAKLSGYSQEELYRWWLANLGVTTPGRGERELFLMLEDAMRADIAVYEAFEHIDLRIRRTPTLVLHGENDLVAPPAVMQTWDRYVHRPRLGAIEGGRHLFVLEQPEAVSAALVEAFAAPLRQEDGVVPGRRRPAADLDRETELHLPTTAGRPLSLGFCCVSPDAAREPEGSEAAIVRSPSKLKRLMERYGAVLVRGLGCDDPSKFAQAVTDLGYAPCSYRGGNSPRTEIKPGVYTSTEHPPEVEITPHAEFSYDVRQAPDALLFACACPSDWGGETPLVDLEAVAAELDPALVERFDRAGLTYIRRLHAGAGLGRSWMHTFQTTDRSEVEAHLKGGGANFEWTTDGLVVRQHAPATIRHPLRRTRVWYNQAEQWHPSNVLETVGEDLAGVISAEVLPHDVIFGDGEPIDPRTISSIRETLWAHAGAFEWRRGDLLLVDNMRMGHARRAFDGERRIMVAMAKSAASEHPMIRRPAGEARAPGRPVAFRY